MLKKLKKVIKGGWEIFWSDKLISLGNVFLLTLTIFVFGATFFVTELAHSIENYFQKKTGISVYFKENVTEEEILNLKKELSQKFSGATIDYISKEMSLEEFKKRHKDSPILMEALKEFDNPFSAYLNINVADPKVYEEISKFLETSSWNSIIERIDFLKRKEFIEKIFNFSRFTKKFLIYLSIFLVLISVIITFLSIRLSILKMGEEIKIQKLVGASNFIVRGPFLFQGILFAILATLFSFSILYSLIYFLSQKVVVFSPQFNLFSMFLKKATTIFVAQFLFSIFLTVVASYISTSRYLKV